MAEFTVKFPVIVCTQTARGNMSHGKKCIMDWKLPVRSGPLESDIGKVRNMSEKATENKVHSYQYNTNYGW